MCNLYAQTASRQLLLELFGVGDNRACTFTSQDAIFPGNNGITVRNTSDGVRECVPMSWGFVLNLKNQAPKRATNFRDDKLDSRFWSSAFNERRCLIPVTSFAEPKGKSPATWHWFALSKLREPFSFAGIWSPYKGQLKKDGDTVEIDVYSFMTTAPNSLVATIHPSRMPVMLVGKDMHDQWLNGNPNDARKLVHSYPSEHMAIIQSNEERRDLEAC